MRPSAFVVRRKLPAASAIDPDSAVQPSPSACRGVPNVHSSDPSGSPARARRKSRAASSSGVLRHAVKVTYPGLPTSEPLLPFHAIGDTKRAPKFHKSRSAR